MRFRSTAFGILAAVLAAAACSRKPASIDISPKKVKIYGNDRAQRPSAPTLDKKGQPIEPAPPTRDADVERVGRRRRGGGEWTRRCEEGGQGDGDRILRKRLRAGTRRGRRRRDDRHHAAGHLPDGTGGHHAADDVRGEGLAPEGPRP